jgi:hypothetical protein
MENEKLPKLRTEPLDKEQILSALGVDETWVTFKKRNG